MVHKPLIRPYFWGGTLGGVGWPAKNLGHPKSHHTMFFLGESKKMMQINYTPLQKRIHRTWKWGGPPWKRMFLCSELKESTIFRFHVRLCLRVPSKEWIHIPTSAGDCRGHVSFVEGISPRASRAKATFSTKQHTHTHKKKNNCLAILLVTFLRWLGDSFNGYGESWPPNRG